MKTMRGVTVAAATVVLLAGCAGSGGAGETVTVTASEGSSSSSSSTSSEEASDVDSSTRSSSSSTVDCSDETLSQSDWIDNCSDEGGFPEQGDSESVEDPDGSMGEPVPVKLGEVKSYPDGLKVKVSKWRQGTEDYIDGPFVLFDVTVENTGSAPISVDFYESAIYGPTGLSASSVGSEEWEDSSRRLQPGAEDVITLDLDVSDPTLPATLTLDFYDDETFDTPRPPMHVDINGGVK